MQTTNGEVIKAVYQTAENKKIDAFVALFAPEGYFYDGWAGVQTRQQA